MLSFSWWLRSLKLHCFMQPLHFGTSGMTKASWEFSFINVFAVHITHMPILVMHSTNLFMFSISLFNSSLPTSYYERIYIWHLREYRFEWRSKILSDDLWHIFILLIFWLPDIFQIDQVYQITVFKLNIIVLVCRAVHLCKWDST